MADERWFFRSPEDWLAIAQRLKQTPCPHCKAVGTLIRHGCLYGFDETSPQRKTLRARRIFCSNRQARRGCGRTFSIWLADKIRRLSLTAGALWRFLQYAVAAGIAEAGRVVDTLVQAIRPAFYKRGVPDQLLVDNGSIYSGQEITLICACVGCILRHTAVRDAAAKGKIERFFRRVRDQFLVRQLDLSSLEALNRQFTHWVESDYNAVPHDALGMKPIDRFGINLSRLRFLPPSEHSDELFYAEAERKVKKDNTFSFAGRRYETPVDLRDKTIQLRFDRRRLGSSAVVIYYKGQRLGTGRLLDAVANGLQRRKEQP